MSSASRLLLQPSPKRSRGEVPKNGEVNSGSGDRSSEAPPVFPSLYYRSPNRISDEASTAQTRSLRKVDEMGHRANRVRHQIKSENCNKRLGPSRLHHGIHSDRTHSDNS